MRSTASKRQTFPNWQKHVFVFPLYLTQHVLLYGHRPRLQMISPCCSSLSVSGQLCVLPCRSSQQSPVPWGSEARFVSDWFRWCDEGVTLQAAGGFRGHSCRSSGVVSDISSEMCQVTCRTPRCSARNSDKVVYLDRSHCENKCFFLISLFDFP